MQKQAEQTLSSTVALTAAESKVSIEWVLDRLAGILARRAFTHESRIYKGGGYFK